MKESNNGTQKEGSGEGEEEEEEEEQHRTEAREQWVTMYRSRQSPFMRETWGS